MKLLELPPDILIDNILLHLDAATLARLSSTCRLFKTLADDELLWKHRVFQDYNLPHDASFRHSGWKTLYAQLSDSAVYTWGTNNDRRLGHSEEQQTMQPFLRGHRARIAFPMYSVNKPKEVTALRGKGIVDIMAGGWSFHALDRHGRVWMWGTMQEDVAYSASLGTRLIASPTRVELPEHIRIRSVSCGRSHAISLAQDGSVWHWNNLWAPQQVNIPTEGTVIQVTANWGYSSVLTCRGELFIIPQPANIRERPEAPQDPMEVHMPALTLADLDLDTSQGDKIVQVTGLEKCTIALTRTGRVIKIRTEPIVDFVASPAQNAVELCKFGATDPEDNDRSRRMYRFITGQFRNFAVYTSDGKALLGDQDADQDTEPRLFPELQRDICKVTFGDYHSGALTNHGELLTWGAYSDGALGHGESRDAEQTVPKTVEELQDKFVFAVGFGGWHSGALTIPRT